MSSRSVATEAASSKPRCRPTKGPTKRKLETIAPGTKTNPKVPSGSQNRERKGFACPTRRRQKKAPSMAAALLGDDGKGYDLAKRLEACGAWRAWLGDAAYAHFSHALSSPATWEVFLSPRAGAGAANGRTQIQLQLQLRARALLYDKASAALFLSHSHSINDINPNFLQLHGDDVYFLLDEEKEDGGQFQSQSAFNARHSESDNLAKWPSSWYKQYAEKFRIRHHKLPAGEKEIPKRTPEGMSAYLKLSAVHKRKRQVFKDYNSPGAPISMNDETLFPELHFPSDCVPDSALPKPDLAQKRPKMEFHAVLDNLPGLVNRSPAMIERFGIMPEYYKVGNKYRGNGGEGKHLTEEQGNAIVRKTLVRFMMSATTYDSTTAGALDVLAEVVSRHVCKLGRSLKILTDSYRKEYSAVDLLKMFIQASGFSIGALSEITKGGNRSGSNQMQQQHTHQLQSQLQNNILQQRQFHQHPQMNVVHAQSLAFQQQIQQQQQQQQLQQLRRNASNANQINSPRGSVMMMDPKTHHPLADVKIENTIDAQMDAQSGFGSAHNQRQQQLQQLRLQHQQQMMMAGNNLVQSNNSNNSLIQPGMQQQFKTMQSVQLSQLQAQNMYGMRTAPVKVEAFHELVSGENEHNKLTPSNK